MSYIFGTFVFQLLHLLIDVGSSITFQSMTVMKSGTGACPQSENLCLL